MGLNFVFARTGLMREIELVELPNEIPIANLSPASAATPLGWSLILNGGKEDKGGIRLARKSREKTSVDQQALSPKGNRKKSF